METYNAVIDFNGDARAYYLRGNLYFDQGNQEQALADYQQAVEKGSDDYELYLGIYESMSSHDMAEDAQKYLNQALDIKGDKTEDLLYKGRISTLLGDYTQGDAEKAEACIREFLDSGEATSYDFYNLGVAELADKDYESALTYFEAGLALKEVPNKQELMKSAISAYEYSGDFASAKTMLEDYLALYPSDEEAQRESTFLETR
jgi:tetratricopeptide (TPR) repeat protein